MEKITKLLLTLLLLVLLLTACNLPGRVNRADGNIALTSAAQTVEAQLTLNAQNLPPTLDTTQQETPQPSITIAPTNTKSPTATATARPCDSAGYIKDVTIPDGTEIDPGETFTKTWRIENLGTCTWTSGYKIVFDEGDAMSGPATQQITSGTISPGDQVDISIELTAPTDPGTYRGTYQLRNADGVVFTVGGFWVEIIVGEPDAYSSKASFEIEQTFFGDLDEGVSPTDPGEDDFYFAADADDDKYLEPTNDAEFRQMGDEEPTYKECNEANLRDDDIEVDEDLVGEWFCFLTSDVRLGKFEVVSLEPDDITASQVLELDYTTWETP